MNTPLEKKMIDGIIKSPSQYLPIGITNTSPHPNRKMRKRKILSAGNNRKMTKGRGSVQNIVLKNGDIKRVLHRRLNNY